MSIRKLLLLLSTLFLSFCIVSAQENKPRFIGEVAILNEDNTLTNIKPEFSQLTMFMVMTVKGTESALRIKQSNEIKFLVRVENTEVSPLKTINVLQLKKSKEKREVGVSTLIDGIENAVKKLRSKTGHMLKIEVESSFARARAILREEIERLREERDYRNITIICDVDII